MTDYDRFLASKEECRDIGAATGDFDYAGATGFLYLGCLFIETRRPEWKMPAAAHAYMLTIGRESDCSDDLPSLERKLFDFAFAEGYFDQ